MEEITYANQQENNPDNNALVADRWHLRVKGVVLVAIEDEQGRRVGPLVVEKGRGISPLVARGETGRRARRRGEREDEDEDENEQDQGTGQVKAFPSLFEIAIPGVLYNPGRSFTSVFLDQPSNYKFTLIGQSPSAVDIYLTAFTARAKLDTAFFQGIPMEDGSRASFVYNTENPLESIVITLREQSGGKIQEIPPTAILGPIESADSIPPTTTIAINDDNMATVFATDNPDGSGVLRTYYTTSLRSFSVYREPFQVPPDATIVMAFSIDRNGNREYPGALRPVLGLSQTHVVFTARLQQREIPPQRVRVLNLDPIPLTGSLEWEVLADRNAPWLLAEPREGRTPGLITLSVDIIGLQPGIYRGNVVVRSITLGTVFAVREVVVELEVRDGGPPIQ